jgi:hypothetical protein
MERVKLALVPRVLLSSSLPSLAAVRDIENAWGLSKPSIFVLAPVIDVRRSETKSMSRDVNVVTASVPIGLFREASRSMTIAPRH